MLIAAGAAPFLAARSLGGGRLVRWATAGWMRPEVLGPLGGLDGVLWRSIAWAARKPFVFRGLPPLVTMRVDDVAAFGSPGVQSPIYWIHDAVRHGFRPWLGLFIYNLDDQALIELRELERRALVTSFPHAFGRPQRADAPPIRYYYPGALAPRADTYDEFIYFDHHHSRPWPDSQAVEGLRAVDDWYAARGGLPMSRYFVPHWYEMGANVVPHVRDRWNADLIGVVMDLDQPLIGVPWLQAGPFRHRGAPMAAFADPRWVRDRPVYYASHVNLAGHQFYNSITEIRDDAGYEWRPDNDVAETTARGVRQLVRAMDSMALASLFTHETDHIQQMRPDTWAAAIAGVAAGIASHNPVFVTADEGIRTVRATCTSHLAAIREDAEGDGMTAVLRGRAQVPTYLHVCTEDDDQLRLERVPVPEFDGETAVRFRVSRQG